MNDPETAVGLQLEVDVVVGPQDDRLDLVNGSGLCASLTAAGATQGGRNPAREARTSGRRRPLDRRDGRGQVGSRRGVDEALVVGGHLGAQPLQRYFAHHSADSTSVSILAETGSESRFRVTDGINEDLFIYSLDCQASVECKARYGRCIARAHLRYT